MTPVLLGAAGRGVASGVGRSWGGGAGLVCCCPAPGNRTGPGCRGGATNWASKGNMPQRIERNQQQGDYQGLPERTMPAQ